MMNAHRKVYLDNAATTPMAPEVIEAMLPYMREEFGNPSSTHYFGRRTKAAIETARKTVAKYLNASPSEIVFTSGGTEADNMAINCAVNDLGVKHIITSPIEHHAVLHTVEEIRKKNIRISYVKLMPNGHVDLDDLEKLLQTEPNTLVTLMHANNEIGNLLPIKKVGELCQKYNAYFHSDTVQTMGHYVIDTKNINVHFLTCGAHKFHGPKGVGFLYKSDKIKINAMLHGGAQERNLRGGTENLYGIVGLAKAMELAYEHIEEHMKYVQGLKTYFIEKLKENFTHISFNGDAEGSSLYTVLNVSFPPNDKKDMLLFMLDINGVAASGGSACSSGSNKGSHVLTALGVNPERANIRFSFSRYNTREDIDYTLQKLTELLHVTVEK